MNTFDAAHPRIGNGTFTTAARREAIATVLTRPALTVSDDDREWFTTGHCVDLAVALHERTGWPFAVVADGADAGGVTPWVHIGVQRLDGQILDAHGANDPDQWTADWGETASEWDGEKVDVRLVIESDPARLGFDPLQVAAQGTSFSRAQRVAGLPLSR